MKMKIHRDMMDLEKRTDCENDFERIFNQMAEVFRSFPIPKNPFPSYGFHCGNRVPLVAQTGMERLEHFSLRTFNIGTETLRMMKQSPLLLQEVCRLKAFEFSTKEIPMTDTYRKLLRRKFLVLSDVRFEN